MATHPIERVLYSKNSLDSAKDNFEKNFVSWTTHKQSFLWTNLGEIYSQYTSIRKAINNVECPVKEKHVRSKLDSVHSCDKQQHLLKYVVNFSV